MSIKYYKCVSLKIVPVGIYNLHATHHRNTTTKLQIICRAIRPPTEVCFKKKLITHLQNVRAGHLAVVTVQSHLVAFTVSRGWGFKCLTDEARSVQ